MPNLYAATIPFITRATDTPADQPFLGTLEGSLRVDRSIAGADGYGGFAQTISEITLINDGEYDDEPTTNSVNGQSIICTIGEVLKDDVHGRNVVSPYEDFVDIASLVGERWWVDRSHLTVEARDHAAKLDVPVQTAIYAGTGGLDGDASIAGKRRPYGDGTVRNATPAMVIAAELVFQCNAGPVTSITAVYDGGVPLLSTADYATAALLRAATLVPGQWASCNAEGYFRLGGDSGETSFLDITVDFTGLHSTTADIIEAVVLAATELTSDDLDAWVFEKLNDDQPASRTYYLDSESDETVADFATKLMRGIGGWWQLSTLGKLQVFRFEAPNEVASAYYDSDGGQLVDVDQVALPQGVDPPPRRRRVTYAHNWTVQPTLYGQVSETDPALAEYLKTPYKIATTPVYLTEAILSDYPFAPDPEPIEGFFVDEVDAAAEALRMLTLYSSGFRPYRMTVKNALFVHQLGQVVHATDSRLGLSAGKYLRLVSIIDDTRDGTTEMIGFG